MKIVQRKYGFKDWDSVCASVGHGGLKEGQVVNRLYEEYRKEQTIENIPNEVVIDTKETPKSTKSKSGITVKGVEDVAVRFQSVAILFPEMKLLVL